MVFRLVTSGEVCTEEIMLACCTVDLPNLIEAVNLYPEYGIWTKQKEYRLQVYDMSESAPGNVPVYLGVQGGDVLTYAVFDREGVSVEMKEATGQFRDTSKRLLASMR